MKNKSVLVVGLALSSSFLKSHEDQVVTGVLEVVQ
jgi:hypothetical protein